jgi:hypothetical protein
VGDGRAALGAEHAVDRVARGGLALPPLDLTVDSEFIPGDDADEGCFAPR